MTDVLFRRSTVRFTRTLGTVVLFAGLSACGGDARPPASGQPATTDTALSATPDIAAAGGVTAYFHEQLVTNGEDVQSEFGSALLTLGMNPRDLQQDTPEHAYQIAREKVDGVQDATAKRELMQALFGSTEPAPSTSGSHEP